MELLHRTFAIGRCLGRGGFGEVYRADMTSSTGLTSSVALKVLRRDLAPGGQAVQRLRDEGAMLARLNHPTILRVHDLVVLDGRVSLVTEYVDGEDLERCLRGPDRIGIRALAEVIGQVASALDAAFNAPLALDGAPLRLVHRDVKPSNVRISRHGEVKLLDFGIARSDEITREARTMTDMMVGSPPYMAPERFLDNEIRPASDVFALGAMVLEGLIGRRVFEVPVTMLASYAIDRHRYEAYVASRFDLVPPGNVGAMIELARPLLAYDPDDRPTAAEVARGCEDLADSLEGSPLARWCRERRWVDPPEEVGDLDGKLLSEGTLARPYPSETTTPLPQPKAAPSAAEEITAPAEVVSRARPASLAVWLGGASVVSTLLGVGGLVIVAATLAVAVGWPSLRTPWPTRSPVVVA
ncbi:MAG: serine/threonine-protein kinase, partial [Myxococcota bacterium]